MKLALSVQYAATRRGLPREAAIARWARAALGGLHRKRVALGIRIVGRREAERLNAAYRGQRRPTNVLSFPFEAPPGTRSDLLGDLVLCAEVVRREAQALQRPAQAHWAHLVVHGIMHLRGYDHANARDAVRMERRETRILRMLGYPDPYAPTRT